MRDQSHHIVSFELVSLEDAAEMQPLVEDVSGAEVLPIHPYVVPLEDAPDLEELADPDVFADPEELAASVDHAGVARALDILSPRQQEVFRAYTGLDEAGIALSRAEVAEQFGLTINGVDSILNRARGRLRAVKGILGVINGENIPGAETETSHESHLAA